MSNYQLFKRGLRLFKGLCLLFLPNVPGAMFIQGGTFIPDSRVLLEKIVLVIEKTLLTFEAEGREFSKFLKSLEQFIRTLKGQNNFW